MYHGKEIILLASNYYLGSKLLSRCPDNMISVSALVYVYVTKSWNTSLIVHDSLLNFTVDQMIKVV